MTGPELVFVFTAIGGAVTFIGTVVVVAWKAKDYFDKQFSDHRKFMYNQFRIRDRAIKRLEFWAVRKDADFQPGGEFVESESNGQGH